MPMLLQEQRPLWQDNYKSMTPVQLVAELERIAKNPHHYDMLVERKLYITTELVLRGDHGPPIIVMEAD
jgi:hypothetical protein